MDDSATLRGAGGPLIQLGSDFKVCGEAGTRNREAVEKALVFALTSFSWTCRCPLL